METRETMQAKYEEAVRAEEQAEQGWRYMIDQGFDSYITDTAWEAVLELTELREAYGAICSLIGADLDK